MATADELLNSINVDQNPEQIEPLVVDLNTRVISIPPAIGILGVESDDDVKRLHFVMPRYYDTIDLSEFSVQVNFENARGGGDFYPVDDLTIVNDNALTFSWLVDRSAFKYSGEVDFSVCMKKYDAEGVILKEFNTTIASMPVLEGLETTAAVLEDSHNALDVVMARLHSIEVANGNGEDGYYTIAQVEETEAGMDVTIIDKNGQTIASIQNGYTPIKGVDYWTAQDESEIKSEAILHIKEVVDDLVPQYRQIVLTRAGWNGGPSQTVNVDIVTKDNLVFVNVLGPDATQIHCVSQSDGTLTFECNTIPVENVYVDLTVMQYRSEETVIDSFVVSDDGEGNVIIS